VKKRVLSAAGRAAIREGGEESEESEESRQLKLS
jgi:hypothetical protein